jgi:hypothetical protein
VNGLSPQQRFRLAVVAGLLLLTAIASSVITAVVISNSRSAVVTATLRPTENIVLVTGSGIRPTLPPSWTPTFTHTPRPPTLTPSLTFTPSITPTLTLDELCAAFTVEHTIINGQPFSVSDQIPYIITTGASGVGIVVRFTNLDTEEIFERFLNRESIVISVPIDQLPGAGRYRWEIGAFTAAYQESCTQSGEFRVVGDFPDASANPPTLDPAGLTPTTPTVTPTVPSATPAPTLNATQQALAEVICEEFTFLYALEDGFVFLPGDRVVFSVSLDAPDAVIRWAAVNTTTGQRIQFDYPGASIVSSESIPVEDLPGSGDYEYSAYLYSPQLGNFCATSGTFRVAAETRTPVPSFTPTRPASP